MRLYMKITDKIKELWNKFFHKNPEIKALPETTSPQPINSFYRNDGSSISITPVLDRVGNQVFEQVLNHRTGELQNIAKYCVCSPEIEQITGSDMKTILIDLDSSFLGNPNYQDYILNTLLSPDRIPKIIGQYENYAGGINLDESGNISGRFIDKGIINGLTASRQENFARYQQEQANRDAAYRQSIEENAKNTPINYKTSHAEDLSQYNR